MHRKGRGMTTRDETLKRTLQSFQMAAEFSGYPINASFGWYVHMLITDNYIDKDCDEIIRTYLNGNITLEEGLRRTKQLMEVKE